MKSLGILLSVFITNSLLAGTISGGGGKLIKYSQNPWFLENVSTVKYCIAKHPDFPNISLVRLDEIVKEGVAKWKEAFLYTKDSYYAENRLAPFSQIRIATQSFIKDCNEPDLRFEFGGLSEDDVEQFTAYKDYVGAAVQTNYDIETLKGTGFIYIASLHGKFSPDESQTDKRAWTVQNNSLLRIVLWHELGHIFGVPHGLIGSREFKGVMDERLPELLINKLYVQAVSNNDTQVKNMIRGYTPLALLKPTLKNELIHCGADTFFRYKHWRKKFGVSDNAVCTKVLIERVETANSIKERVEFYESSMGKSGPWFKFGYLKKDSTSGRRSQDLQTRVFLPRGQKVFSRLPGSTEEIGLAPLFGEIKTLSESYEGTYVSTSDGESMGMKVTANVGGKIEFTIADKDMKIYSFHLDGF